MNKKLFRRFPSKFLCPYCGEWHSVPFLTLPLGMYSSNRPLKLHCPDCPDVYIIRPFERHFDRSEGTEYFSNGNTSEVTKATYEKLKHECVKLKYPKPKLIKKYNPATLFYFVENGQLHFRTHRQCKATEKTSFNIFFESRKDIRTSLQISSIEKIENNIFTFSVENTVHHNSPYSCNFCNFSKCLFRLFRANVKLGFEFF